MDSAGRVGRQLTAEERERRALVGAEEAREKMDGLKLFAFTCGTFQSPRSFFGTEEQDIIRSPVPAYLIGVGLRPERAPDFARRAPVTAA